MAIIEIAKTITVIKINIFLKLNTSLNASCVSKDVTRNHLLLIESEFWLLLPPSLAATNIAFPEENPTSLNIAFLTVL